MCYETALCKISTWSELLLPHNMRIWFLWKMIFHEILVGLCVMEHHQFVACWGGGGLLKPPPIQENLNLLHFHVLQTTYWQEDIELSYVSSSLVRASPLVLSMWCSKIFSHPSLVIHLLATPPIKLCRRIMVSYARVFGTTLSYGVKMHKIYWSPKWASFSFKENA